MRNPSASTVAGEAFLEIGFHTAAFNSAYTSFDHVIDWARAHGVHGIECGFIDGVAWNHGLGYYPHLAAWEDPRSVGALLADRGVALSQLDAAFPLSAREGETVGVPYVIDAIRWASLCGCPMVDTTDGLRPPAGLTERQITAQMARSYERIVSVAERYGVVVTVETHGFLTSKAKTMMQILSLVDSPHLRMTFDTGNVFIAGNNPPEFLERFVDKVAHVHVKDVAPRLSAVERGRQSGIGMSQSAVGDGVNADNIRQCLRILKDCRYRGAVSVECEAAGGPVMERSLQWLSRTLGDLGIANDLDRAGGSE